MGAFGKWWDISGIRVGCLEESGRIGWVLYFKKFECCFVERSLKKLVLIDVDVEDLMEGRDWGR